MTRWRDDPISILIAVGTIVGCLLLVLYGTGHIL